MSTIVTVQVIVARWVLEGRLFTNAIEHYFGRNIEDSWAALTWVRKLSNALF
jgi:hypothetical protein